MDDDNEQKNRWGTLPSSDELHNLDYDFEGYFERHKKGELSESEKADFSARIYGMFCRDFYKSGGDVSKLSFMATAYIADRLYEALQGAPWQDIMRMPWDVPTPMFTPKGQRAFDIYAGVENERVERPEANVTDLIAKQASVHHVSFETARADYYAMRQAIKWKKGIPDKFLNRPVDS
jgi:hypothetical protein